MRLLTSPADLAALRVALKELAVAGNGGSCRTWAFVGPVPGADRAELMDLGRLVVRLGISDLVAVGEAGAVHAGAVLEGSWGEESRHVADAEAALTLLAADLHEDDAVLVSGVPAVLAALGGVA